MKLSEISTDRFLDIICDITPYVTEIVEDEEIKKTLIEKIKNASGSKDEIIELGVGKTLNKITKLIPLLLRKRRNSVYGILSVINEKNIEEYRNQNSLVTIKELNELLKDESFVDFFTQLNL